jgi:hypothetical protein
MDQCHKMSQDDTWGRGVFNQPKKISGMIWMAPDIHVKLIFDHNLDVQWGNWGSWSNCVSCTNQKTRTRSCNLPSTDFGGRYCSSEEHDYSTCYNSTCYG